MIFARHTKGTAARAMPSVRVRRTNLGTPLLQTLRLKPLCKIYHGYDACLSPWTYDRNFCRKVLSVLTS